MRTTTILFVSILTIKSFATVHSSEPRGLFNQDELFKEQPEAPEENDGSFGPYNVAAASVTYDKKEYLGDMVRDYFSQMSDPPLFQSRPVGGQNMGSGYGKIDISIQYGMPGNDNPPALTRAVGVEPELQQIGEIVIHNDPEKQQTSRFHNPPSAVSGYPGSERMVQMSGFAPMMYNGQEYVSYEEDAQEDNSNKRFYHQKDITKHATQYKSTTTRPGTYYETTPKTYNKQQYNNYHYEEKTTTPKPTTPMYKPKHYQEQHQFDSSPVLAKEQFYTVQNQPYEPHVSPMSAQERGPPNPADRSSFYTNEQLLPVNSYGGYMSTPSSYYQREDPTRSVSSTTDPNLTAENDNTPQLNPTPSYMYYANHVTPRSLLQDISKIVIQDVPSRLVFSGQMSKNTPEQGNMHEPYNTQYQSSVDNKRNIRQNYYQKPSNVYQMQQVPENRFQTPVPSFTSNQNERNYQPDGNKFQNGMKYYDTKTKPSSDVPKAPKLHKTTPQPKSVGTTESDNLIKKNRQHFLKLQRQAYDLFTKATLNDFKELLIKGIHDKNIEVLPGEKNMLDSNIESLQELNSNVLDYLTIYERHSDILNDTELANHLLQDMDRAKEYLNMKLNKFWVELEEMKTPDEFKEKKDYYKNREKPTGIMNIFYDWYEKLVTNPGKIDQTDIQLELVEIMKKERRYWLVLLRS